MRIVVLLALLMLGFCSCSSDSPRPDVRAADRALTEGLLFPDLVRPPDAARGDAGDAGAVDARHDQPGKPDQPTSSPADQ